MDTTVSPLNQQPPDVLPPNDELDLAWKADLPIEPEAGEPFPPTDVQEEQLSEAENFMRMLWAQALAINPEYVRKNDDFFLLGGSPTGALRLSRLARDHGLVFSVRDVFQNPILLDLSALALTTVSDTIPPFSLLNSSWDQRQVRARAAQLCHAKESQILDILPCTPLQEGLLALTQIDSSHYVAQHIFEIDSNLDIQRLCSAWDQVAAMNPILRTRIVDVPDHGIVQVVLDGDVPWIFSPSFEQYQEDKPHSLGLGDPLTWVAIVGSDNTLEPRFFIWETHHALYDGWSLPLILNDVEHAYYRESGPSLLSTAGLIKYIHGCDQADVHQFWVAQFAELEGTHFPSTVSGARYSESPRAMTTSRQVNDLNWGSSDFTAATIIRAAWAVVAAHHTNSNEALYGVTVTGRQAPVPGIEYMAGPAISTVPLRVKVDWKGDVHRLLKAVQYQAADMIPFEQTGLRGIRCISESAATACKFRSLLVIQPVSEEGDLQEPQRPFLSEASRKLRPTAGGAQDEPTITYSIEIECQMLLDGVTARIDFDSNVIGQAEMDQIAKDFGDVLRQLIIHSVHDSNETAVADVVKSTPRSMEGVVDPVILSWNAHVPEHIEECVHGKIADRVHEDPQALAVCAWDGDLTYQQLDETSTQLALQLVSLGVTGRRVPLLFEKSLWMPVAVLAVMKAGGCLVALDMKQPEERLIRAVSQTNSPVLLCSEQTNDLARRIGPSQQLVVPGINNSRDAESQQPACEVLPAVDPGELLYVVFTSGSTGTPKGVRITHRNFCTAIAYQREQLGYNERSRVFDFASYAFDVAWSNLFLTLTSGGCLCIPSAEERENYLGDCLTKYNINFMDSTPSLARALGPNVLSRLTTLVLGGESMLPSDVSLAGGGPTRIVNAYGPAECTPTTLLAPLDATGTRIGRGAGVCTWIVEEDNPRKLAPIGTVGELWIEGPLVGDGYLNDAEKTAASFIQDPLWLVEHVGRRGFVYRTGDLVRYDPDGTVIFIGRKDNQVKVRGQRVELGEVEAAIKQIIHQSVSNVAVEAIQAPESPSLTLVAFVTLHGAEVMTKEKHDASVQEATEGLAGRLEELLPSYMIPAEYFSLQELPVMATGKTDRKSLRGIGQTMLLQVRSNQTKEDDSGYESGPLDETQAILQKVWMSVLNISSEEASINQPFMRLGGDSISAMQIVSQCRMHNLNLTVSDILQDRTIRNLAIRCKQASPQQLAPVNHSDDDDDDGPSGLFDLTPIQRAFFDIYPDGLNHYNQSFLLDLGKPVSESSLRAALEAIISRHAMLRARFEKDSTTGSWRQKIAANSPEVFAFVGHAVKDRTAAEAFAQWRQENLDIRHGPVFACDLFNFGEDSQTVLLSAHHLVMDLVSWRILWAELEEHVSLGKVRSPQTLSFRAWSRHQAQIGRTLSPLSVLPYPIPEPQLDFWGVSLDENTFGQCDCMDSSFSLEVSQLIFGKSNDSLRTEGVDLILSALIHSFVHTFPERPVPAMWLEGHGREQLDDQQADVSGTVGWFTTLYPLAIPIELDDRLSHVVRLVKDTRYMVPGKGQPFSACRYYSESGREAFKGHDINELVFNFTGRFQQLERDDGLLKQSSSPDPSNIAFTITEISKSARRPSMIDIDAGVVDGELKVSFTFHKKMDQGRVRNWILEFTRDLEALAQNLAEAQAEFTIADLPLLPLSYRGVDELVRKQIPRMGIKSDAVTDIYPCSPLQEGMLLSVAKGAASYHTYTIMRCVSNDGDVCPSKLESVWKKVVKKHTILSSIFSLHPEGSGFIQMVLNAPSIRVVQKETEDGLCPTTPLHSMEVPTFAPNEPRHMLTISRSNTGEVACRLDMDHVLTDAHSVDIILGDLAVAYDGGELPSATPEFVDIIRYIQKTPRERSVAKWAARLDGVEPCNFPVSSPPLAQELREALSEVSSPTSTFKISIIEFCKKAGIMLSAFLQVAWAMVLSHHTGMHDVCFGYVTSGRDAPIAGVERLVGPLANLLISRVNLLSPAGQVLRTTSDRAEENLAIQNVSMAEILHRVGVSGRRLFNTSLTLRYAAKTEETTKRELSFQPTESEDVHEYDLKLSVLVNTGNDIDFLIEYREPYISRQMALEICGTLNEAVECLLATDDTLISSDSELEISSPTVMSHKELATHSLLDSFFAQTVRVKKSVAQSFWKAQFAGVQGCHFPTVKSRASHIRREDEVNLLMQGIDLAGRDFTADVLVRASWAILTARVSGMDESLFGATLLGGGHLPIRITLDWQNSINCLLDEVQRQFYAMVPFQRMRLEQVSALSDEAALACDFRTLLVIHSERDEGGEDQVGSAQKLEEHLNGEDNCVLVVEVQPAAGSTHLRIKFDSHVIEPRRVSRLAQGLEHVLRRLLDADRRHDMLADVTVASKCDLNDIWAWNETLPPPVEGCINDLILEQVIQRPYAAAINAWDGDLTYAQLHELSSKLAHQLVTNGVRKGSIVPLCFEKSMWMPVAALAVMKTGAASVAIDTSLPEQRIRSMVSKVFTSSEVKVLLSSLQNDALCQLLGGGKVLTVGSDLYNLQIPSGSTPPPWPNVSPSDVLYIVFTSGTSGDAKGVVITHQNFRSAIAYQRDALGLNSSSRMFDFASYAFDVVWLNLLKTLTAGGCLCVPSAAERENDLAGSLEKYKATIVDLTPSVARIIEPKAVLSNLDTLILGGEAVSSSDVDLVGELTQVNVAYGPAECTPTSAILHLTQSPTDGGIGPGVGVCTWVVDVENPDSLAAIGAVGELYVEGPLVGQGYLHDPEKTAKAFIQCPEWLLSGSPDGKRPGRHGKLYRTGDLVRYNEDGSLVFVGRRDTQVKIRGQRVELGDVEHHVRRTIMDMAETKSMASGSNVQVIADVVHLPGVLEKTLVAFVCLDQGSEGSGILSSESNDNGSYKAVKEATVGINEQIAKVLPVFMLPSVYIPLQTVPFSTTGKVDRRQLQQLVSSLTTKDIAALNSTSSSSSSTEDRRPPQSDTELLMQGLWAEVLQIETDRISANDSFFRVGGDSIAAMRIVALGRYSGLEFTVRDVFQHPILQDLCRQCRREE